MCGCWTLSDIAITLGGGPGGGGVVTLCRFFCLPAARVAVVVVELSARRRAFLFLFI